MRFLDERHLHLDGAGCGDAESFLARLAAPQSRYSCGSDLRQLHRWAAGEGLLEVDELARLELPKVPRRRPTPVDPADVARLLTGTAGPDRVMVALAVYAGLRVSEIAALHTGDVDLVARTMRVVGKGDIEHVLPVADELAALLRDVAPGPVVPYSSGHSVSDRLRRLMRAHGIGNRPHDLRASYATALDGRLNGNVVRIARYMRHAEPATTMRYLRPAELDDRDVTGLYGAA